MALIIHFKPTGMNQTKYADVMKKLEAAGAGSPRGRLHHTCYGAKDALQVVDIYDTQESFEAFGKVLMPILASVGVDPGPPAISEVCNIVRA